MGRRSSSPTNRRWWHDVTEANLAIPDSPDDGLDASRDAQPTFGRFHMLVHGALADTKQLTDVPVALALSRHFQALPLTLAEYRSRLEPAFARGIHDFAMLH